MASRNSVAARPVLAVFLVVGARLQDLDPEGVLDGLRTLAEQRRWTQLAEDTSPVRGRLEPGQTAWFEASALLARALYQELEFERVIEIGGEVASAVRDGTGAAPHEAFEPLGRLGPREAVQALEAYVLLGQAFQACGRHDEAVAALTPIPGLVLERPLPALSRRVLHAGLDLGRSLHSLGCHEEARLILRGVRDKFRGTSAAAMATALLQGKPGGLSEYRGLFEGDPEHARRVQELFALLPGARARLAAGLGREAHELPSIPVGVADRPREHEGEGAFTEGDARSPFAPIVVVFAETLALDLQDPMETLVHELAHGVLLAELGLSYERLPPWITEGLSNALAGEFPALILVSLEHRLVQEADRFLDPGLDLAPDIGGQERLTPETGLALSFLEPAAVPRLVAALRNGASLDEALLETTGLTTTAFLSAAREHVRRLFEEQRSAARADLEVLERSKHAGPAACLEAAEAVLAGDPTALARGRAMHLRAIALEFLGEHERALTAHEELLAERRLHPLLAWDAHAGRIRILIALDRLEEARAQLVAVGRMAPLEALRLELRSQARLGR